MTKQEQELRDLVVRYYERAFNHGEFDVVEEVASDDQPFACDSNSGWDIQGVEGIKASIARQRHAFRDFNFTIDELFVAGEKVTLWWTARGIFENPLVGFEPTGEHFEFRGASMLEFVNGKMAGGRSCADLQEQLLQLRLAALA